VFSDTWYSEAARKVALGTRAAGPTADIERRGGAYDDAIIYIITCDTGTRVTQFLGCLVQTLTQSGLTRESS
jgi:hypothetical protein